MRQVYPVVVAFQGGVFFVARGPVPRACWDARTMARDRPSPYGEGVFFS